MFVKPRTGFKIPDPNLNDFLPVDGREVENNSYWVRRLRDGDVVEAKAAKPQSTSTKKEVKE